MKLRSAVPFAATLFLAGCSGPSEGTVPTFPALEILTEVLPDATVNVAYTASLVARGGNGVYTWSVIDGALPDGLSMSSGGSIAGTPTTAGVSTFMAQVNTGDAQQATREFTLAVVP